MTQDHDRGPFPAPPGPRSELFMISLEEPVPEVLVLQVCGRLDQDTAGQLNDIVVQQLGGRPQLVVLDLEHVSFLAPEGVAALARAAIQAGEARIGLCLTGVDDVVWHPLHAAGQLERFQLYDTVHDALDSLG